MNLSDALSRDRGQIRFRIIPVVGGTNVQIVYIEQDATIRLRRDSGEEFPFWHARMVEDQVAGDILDEDLSAKLFLNGLHSRGHMVDGLFCIGQWEQVMCIVSATTAPAQVVRHPGRLTAGNECLELAEITLIEWIR